MAMNCASKAPHQARQRGLAHAGGPQRIMDCSRPASKAIRSGMPGPARMALADDLINCRGRSRSAKGRCASACGAGRSSVSSMSRQSDQGTAMRTRCSWPHCRRGIQWFDEAWGASAAALSCAQALLRHEHLAQAVLPQQRNFVLAGGTQQPRGCRDSACARSRPCAGPGDCPRPPRSARPRGRHGPASARRVAGVAQHGGLVLGRSASTTSRSCSATTTGQPQRAAPFCATDPPMPPSTTWPSGCCRVVSMGSTASGSSAGPVAAPRLSVLQQPALERLQQGKGAVLSAIEIRRRPGSGSALQRAAA